MNKPAARVSLQTTLNQLSGNQAAHTSSMTDSENICFTLTSGSNPIKTSPSSQNSDITSMTL